MVTCTLEVNAKKIPARLAVNSSTFFFYELWLNIPRMPAFFFWVRCCLTLQLHNKMTTEQNCKSNTSGTCIILRHHQQVDIFALSENLSTTGWIVAVKFSPDIHGWIVVTLLIPWLFSFDVIVRSKHQFIQYFIIKIAVVPISLSYTCWWLIVSMLHNTPPNHYCASTVIVSMLILAFSSK